MVSSTSITRFTDNVSPLLGAVGAHGRWCTYIDPATESRVVTEFVGDAAAPETVYWAPNLPQTPVQAVVVELTALRVLVIAARWSVAGEVTAFGPQGAIVSTELSPRTSLGGSMARLAAAEIGSSRIDYVAYWGTECGGAVRIARPVRTLSRAPGRLPALSR
jgi:hypothetical protein